MSLQQEKLVIVFGYLNDYEKKIYQCYKRIYRKLSSYRFLYGTYEEYEETLKPYTTEQRYLLAMHWLGAEVANGGF